MIGIGWTYNNEWSYYNFKLENLSENNQKVLINDFYKYIKDICTKYNEDYLNVPIYHWSNFEPTILNKVIKKIKLSDKIVLNWSDLLIFFKSVPITIKGAKNYSLKSIGKAMYNNN
jgi:predicted RecB family nuclease